MKIAVLVTSLPLDGIAARESLDLIFALAAVDHQVSVIFCDDAVYQLVKADDSAGGNANVRCILIFSLRASRLFPIEA